MFNIFKLIFFCIIMTIFDITLFWVRFAPSYYWLMYAIGFLVGYYIIKMRWKISPTSILEDLFFYIFLWVILWWRLWYVIFYDFFYYINNPLQILKIWEWWMSFHWWVIWVIIAMILFARKFKISFLWLADQITLVLPIWLWLWRIWNYLNKELLWYWWYDWFFAVYKDWVWYFPSPLLEAILEWFVLFFVLNIIYYIDSKKNFLYKWQIACLFLVFYWFFRIFVEVFFRQPDTQIWYIFWVFTMWEILSFPMILIWIIIYFILKYKKWN